METRHITNLLDNTKFGDLSVGQISEINAHAAVCAECRRAFQTARIAALLLKEKADFSTPAPSPFFQAKVLNMWREKQIIQQPYAVFRRWWQTSATLVVLMFLTVIGLIAATFIKPYSKTAFNQKINPDAALYSTETVILNQRPVSDLTTEQIYEVLDESN